MRIRVANKSRMTQAERLGLAVLACVAVAAGCLIGADCCSEGAMRHQTQLPAIDSVGVDTTATPARNGREIKKRPARKKEGKKVEPHSRDYLNEPAR